MLKTLVMPGRSGHSRDRTCDRSESNARPHGSAQMRTTSGRTPPWSVSVRASLRGFRTGKGPVDLDLGKIIARAALMVLAAIVYGVLVGLGHDLAEAWDRPNLAVKGSLLAALAGVVFVVAAVRRLALSSREVAK
jgi:hypothetical protein